MSCGFVEDRLTPPWWVYCDRGQDGVVARTQIVIRVGGLTLDVFPCTMGFVG